MQKAPNVSKGFKARQKSTRAEYSIIPRERDGKKDRQQIQKLSSRIPYPEGEEKMQEDGNNLGEQMHSFLILPIWRSRMWNSLMFSLLFTSRRGTCVWKIAEFNPRLEWIGSIFIGNYHCYSWQLCFCVIILSLSCIPSWTLVFLLYLYLFSIKLLTFFGSW